MNDMGQNVNENKRECHGIIGEQSDDKETDRRKANTAYLEILRNLEEGRVRYN